MDPDQAPSPAAEPPAGSDPAIPTRSASPPLAPPSLGPQTPAPPSLESPPLAAASLAPASLAPTSLAPTSLALTSLSVVDLNAGDTGTVRAVIAGLSAESRYRRFQSSRPTPPSPVLRQLAAAPSADRCTHVALLDGAPVGLVHWYRLPGSRDAEVACEVVDAAQHRGIGKALLRQAALSAAERGIEAFVAHLWVGDTRLFRRARAAGAVPDRSEPGRVRLPVEAAAAVR